MALTVTLRTDMQADLAIGAAEDIFTNDELDRLYERAADSYNLAVYYGFRQLLADANKFHDYQLANATVKRSQMRDHLKDMVEFWEKESQGKANQVMIVGGLKVPTQRPEMPIDLRRDTRTNRYVADGQENRRSQYEVNRGQ